MLDIGAQPANNKWFTDPEVLSEIYLVCDITTVLRRYLEITHTSLDLRTCAMERRVKEVTLEVAWLTTPLGVRNILLLEADTQLLRFRKEEVSITEHEVEFPMRNCASWQYKVWLVRSV